MLKLTFTPDSKGFTNDAKAYTDIWKEDGEKISKAIETATDRKFKDELIEVTVFEGVSQSHPMKLRASYDDETKRATIVHELLHRISADYMLPLPEPNDDLSLGLHKQIYLVLYDLWVQLYGKQAADRQVALESSRTPMYKDAWDWALGLSGEQRTQKFAQLSKQ